MKRRRFARAVTVEVVGHRVVITGSNAPADSAMLAYLLPDEARRLARNLVDHAREAERVRSRRPRPFISSSSSR